MSTSRFGAYSKGWRNQGGFYRGVSHACSDEFVNNPDDRTVKVFMNISVMSDRHVSLWENNQDFKIMLKNEIDVQKLKQKMQKKKVMLMKKSNKSRQRE